MQDNSKPCIFAVKDVYEMHSVASRHPADTIYVVNNNRYYISCEDGSLAPFGWVATTPVTTLFDSAAATPMVEKTRTSYPDEDTYRI